MAVQEIKIPEVGESISEATIAEWTKQSGDFVKRDEIVLVLETDKASVEVVAEADGKLTTKAEEGDTVDIGAVVAEIDTSASAPAGAPNGAATAAPEPQAQAASPAGGAIHEDLKSAQSPAVRRLATEQGVDTSSVVGSGRGGRVTKGDVLEHLKSVPGSAPAKTEIPPLPAAQTSGGPEQTREKMTRLRSTIARRLVESQQSTATLTTFNEFNMKPVMDLRAKYKESFKEKHGISLGFMGFFVKATIEALKQYPRVNAYIDGEEVVYNNGYHVGIAVSTDKGLMVPVIRNAQNLSLAEIELSIRHFALKARDGKISPGDLAGGTFTVSNGGVFGSLMSTPILNPPQSGILGLHKIEERPMVENSEVVVRPMMYAALSYDHRMIDGRESVGFLVRIKECIEDPARLLLEI